MTRSSRESRREAARARERAEQRQRWLLPVIAVGVVLLAAVAAVFLVNGSAGGGSSDLPSAQALYASEGFVEVGRVVQDDRERPEQQSGEERATDHEREP